MNSAMFNDRRLVSLLRQQGIELRDQQSVRNFLQNLSSFTQGEETTLAMVDANLNKYQHLIRKALEETQIEFTEDDFNV